MILKLKIPTEFFNRKKVKIKLKLYRLKSMRKNRLSNKIKMAYMMISKISL